MVREKLALCVAQRAAERSPCFVRARAVIRTYDDTRRRRIAIVIIAVVIVLDAGGDSVTLFARVYTSDCLRGAMRRDDTRPTRANVRDCQAVRA